MHRRLTGAALALLLVLAVPAGALRAAEPAPPATVTAPTGPPRPAPLPEPKITSAQAEATLREFFTLPQPSAQLELHWGLSRHGDQPAWELQITIREGDVSSTSTLAMVDALTGRVLRYGDNWLPTGPVRTGPLAPVHTEDEARARAWSLVQKLAPEQAAVLKESPAGLTADLSLFYAYWGDELAGGVADLDHFTWVEYHDGVPFPASSVSVGVEKHTLEYRTVTVDLADSVKFQAGPAKVTAADALKLWQAGLHPRLSYQPVYNVSPHQQPKATAYKLVYSFDNMGRAVDAMTGAWIEDHSPGRSVETKVETPEPVPAGSVTPLVPPELPLTDVAAHKLALAILELPQDAELRSSRDTYNDEKVLRFNFSGQTEYATVEFDPTTGLIRNADRQQSNGARPANPDQTKVNPEQEAQAKQAAFAAVQTYYSQIRDQLRLDSLLSLSSGPQDSQRRWFQFVRYVNGVALPEDSVMITIDLSTMKWAQMNARWTTGVTWPSPAGAISPEKAKEAVLADHKPVLVYQPVYPTTTLDQLRSGRMPQPAEAVLVYVLSSQLPTQVDALTGQSLPFGPLGMSDPLAAAKKVTGHWAEGELQFMLARRIVPPDHFNPDAALTRGQAVALLLTRTQRMVGLGRTSEELPYTDLPDTDPAYGAVRVAWQEGWLRPLGDEKTFRPGAPVTRTEFVVWAARALGLGELARSDLTVQTEYKDLSTLTAEQRNAVAFLRALGLLSPAATFRGGDPLTQAEGAALTVRIYNRLLRK